MCIVPSCPRCEGEHERLTELQRNADNKLRKALGHAREVRQRLKVK